MKIQLFPIVTQHNPSVLTDFGLFSRPEKGLVRKNAFCETFILSSLFLWYPLFCEIFSSFTKMGDIMKQLDLLPLETLPPRVKYKST